MYYIAISTRIREPVAVLDADTTPRAQALFERARGMTAMQGQSFAYKRMDGDIPSDAVAWVQPLWTWRADYRRLWPGFWVTEAERDTVNGLAPGDYRVVEIIRQ